MVLATGGAGDAWGHGSGAGGGGDDEFPMFTVKLHEPRGNGDELGLAHGASEFAPVPAEVVDEEPSEILVTESAAPVDASSIDEPAVASIAPLAAIPVESPEPTPASRDTASVSGPGAIVEIDANAAGTSAAEIYGDDEVARTLTSGGLVRAGRNTSAGSNAGDATHGAGSSSELGQGDGALNAASGGEKGHGTVAATLVFAPHPDYPSQSMRRSEEGSVVCLMHVDVDGRVVRVDVTQSSGYPLLDRAAVDSLTRWRFRPAMRAGEPAPFTFSHTVRFVLR